METFVFTTYSCSRVCALVVRLGLHRVHHAPQEPEPVFVDALRVQGGIHPGTWVLAPHLDVLRRLQHIVLAAQTQRGRVDTKDPEEHYDIVRSSLASKHDGVLSASSGAQNRPLSQ